jgi:hypothetical protein
VGHANEKAVKEVGQRLHTAAREFFGSCFQSYISEVLKSDLKLDLNSAALVADDLNATLEAMSPERGANLGRLTSGVAKNSVHLASATLAVISAGLTRQQGQAAAEYAARLISTWGNLNSFERMKAHEWVTSFCWSDA